MNITKEQEQIDLNNIFNYIQLGNEYNDNKNYWNATIQYNNAHKILKTLISKSPSLETPIEYQKIILWRGNCCRPCTIDSRRTVCLYFFLYPGRI